MVRADQLESARFVGDVQVNLGEQKLTSHQLDVAFRPNAGGQSLEELLDVANASGDVTLASGESHLHVRGVEAGVRSDADARAVSAADGRCRGGRHQPREIERARQSRFGGPAPPWHRMQRRVPSRLFVIRTLDVVGEAELVDPGNHVAAHGGEIAATFEGVNQLANATVSGSGDEFGVVHARPYTVRGGRVELDRSTQTVHVDGPSRLALQRGAAWRARSAASRCRSKSPVRRRCTSTAAGTRYGSWGTWWRRAKTSSSRATR